MKLWGGRFDEAADRRAADYTRSIEVDAALAVDDVTGSLAHVRGLGRAGLLTAAEVAALVAGRRPRRTAHPRASSSLRPLAAIVAAGWRGAAGRVRCRARPRP